MYVCVCPKMFTFDILWMCGWLVEYLYIFIILNIINKIKIKIKYIPQIFKVKLPAYGFIDQLVVVIKYIFAEMF